VVTQPYDKIPHELQQEYYRRSPYSVVRITRNADKNEDPDTDYPDAGRTFAQWLADGVLIQEGFPAIYAYYQEYEIEGKPRLQKGFIALLDLKHSASAILPHERTMAEPKMDRLHLMRRLECDDDLIYMLYTDDRLAVNRALDEHTSKCPPDIKVKDDYEVLHRVWGISDPRTVKRIQDAIVPEELFIADGHHRFETSVNFMKECEARGWRPAALESFDKRLIACFNSADQGTTILPTHRLVRGIAGFSSHAFLELATRYFEVEEIASADVLWDRMKQGRRVSHVFGCYAADSRRFHLLSLKEEAKVDPLMLAHPEAYRHLDVSLLHTLILDRFLGIDEAKLVAQTNVDYARDREECIRAVKKGRYQAAFFLNPTTVEQVQRIALLGERMPQKSTDFYPKLLTGLVLMKMEIAK
jgi:uncharacterized protein (DUF1015 family)